MTSAHTSITVYFGVSHIVFLLEGNVTKSFVFTNEHLRFNVAVATDLGPAVGNLCRTASRSLRTEEHMVTNSKWTTTLRHIRPSLTGDRRPSPPIRHLNVDGLNSDLPIK